MSNKKKITINKNEDVELDRLEKIIDLFEKKGLEELEVEHAGLWIKMKKTCFSSALQTTGTTSVESQGAVDGSAPHQSFENTQTVKSPMVGTFYRSSSPTSEVFIKNGDIVEKGDVLCIIEAMKIMNEIESEVRGRIVSILVENGHPVEYGESLFLIEPIP